MTAVRQITKDNAYDAVSPDDFEAMMDTGRYNRRSSAFDKIISATHDHFWDPMDARYIDYSEPFDIENEMLIDPELVPELKLACFEALPEKEKVRFVNETARWMMSAILH
ncbi:MAG: ferritin-like domain-containing protein, partial [Parvibaculum sp.]